MDCSAMVFVDEFSNFFQNFLSFCRCLVSYLQLTLHRLRNVNAIQKPLPSLKKFSKSFKKHFMGFGSGFTELQAKLDAGTLLDFAIHSRQNET
jgi:hypothetical protein